MKIVLLSFLTLLNSFLSIAQLNSWQSFTDSIPTLSSPRACDLNNDGVKDIIIGGGTDGVASNNGIMAFNGVDGTLLWKRPSRNEVFGSPIFQDITNDGIKDVFISGRQAQLLAINGSNGQLIWDYFPYSVNPADSGLYNFYNPQFIPDVNNDGKPDLLVTNGGNHAAPDWETDRPPGHLMIINSMNGQLIAKGVVPDSAETYCSPLVVDLQGNGNLWILYGTGGETLGGSFWACPLNDLLQSNSLLNLCSVN
jgi:outer membrane protein assembly factor BamB